MTKPDSATSKRRVAGALDFVRRRIEAGVPPTCVQIGEHLGVSSVAAWKIVEKLIAAGRLVRVGKDRHLDLPARIGAHRSRDVPGLSDLSGVRTEDLQGELARRGATLDALRGTQPMSGGRPCAATGCFVHVQRGKLFCLDHWRALPRNLQNAILDAFRARDEQAYSDALENARDHLGGFTRVLERAE